MAVDRERTYHSTLAAYLLPNDATEHERLELQTLSINTMMHGQVNHAPINGGRKILEIGCGTGSTTEYLAKKYSTAKEVIGVDLSAVPLDPSSSRVRFLQGDFRSLAGHDSLQHSSFDYIFSRMLVFGITDWPDYISQAKELLKPGGWLELQEIDFAYFNADRKPISDGWGWLRDQTAAFSNRGFDIRVATKLEQYLNTAGFVDVQAKEYRWVYGRWQGHPETDMMGEYSPKFLIPTNLAAYRKVLGSIKSAQELAIDEAEMRETLAYSEEGKHQRFFVVFGRKS